MLENEKRWRPEPQVREGLLTIWHAMEACVKRGCEREGILPGGLKVQAPRRHAAPPAQGAMPRGGTRSARCIMDWVNLFALAVNEENAAGGRVVTAPTNGAAGIIPAVLHYYRRFLPDADDDGAVRFLLTAGADRHALQDATPRSPAPRWAARARSASPAPWPPPASPR